MQLSHIILENMEAINAVDFIRNDVAIFSKKPKQHFIDKGYIVMPYDDGMELLSKNEDEKFISKSWIEITDDQWYEALEVLPPMKWSNVSGFEFFFCSEALTSNIHACYCSVDDKYFTATKRTTTSYKSMIDELRGEKYVK